MREIKPKRMLVILAHPDDGCSTMEGTLVKYALQDVQIVLLCAFREEVGVPGNQPDAPEKSRLLARLNEIENLGVEVYSLGYQVNNYEITHPEMFLETISCWMDLVQPQVILSFGPEDPSHPDHVAISRIVTQAYDLSYKKGILLYLVRSDTTPQGRFGIFSLARDAKSKDNYPDWFQPEMEAFLLS